MAVASKIQIIGTLTGLETGTHNVNILTTAAVGQVQTVTLASGDNTINAPSGMSSVIVKPPASNSVVIKFGSSTGTPLHKTRAKIVDLDTGTTSFVLNAASSIAGVELIWFA